MSDLAISSDANEVSTRVDCDYPRVLSAAAEDPLGAHEQYRGSFLKGCDLSVFGPEFETWAYQHRSALAETLRSSLLAHAELCCLNGQADQAGTAAEYAWLLSGADEPTTETLTRLHNVFLILGHKREAEVRLEAIRFGASELNGTTAEALTQIAARFSSTQLVNLPQPLSSFVGRAPELAELSDLLRNTDTRLVTLQGIGGSGKSQLALQVAHQLSSDPLFRDGIRLVRLEAVPDHRLLPLVLASALGLTLQGTGNQVEQLAEFISRKRMLLVLDNYEHLIEAATWTEHLELSEIAAEAERAPASLEARFRDAPPRHRSLLATLEQTWSLLNEVERALLRELTVFQGGFRKEAAATILGADLRQLVALVHKSLLRVSNHRYELHPLLREYAREHLELDAARYSQLRGNHAAYYLDVLARVSFRITGGRNVQNAVLELQDERANVGAAWRWAVQAGNYERLIEAYEGLAHYGEVTSTQTWVITLLREARARLGGQDGHTVASFNAALALLSYRIEDATRGQWQARLALDSLTSLELHERNPGLWAAHYAHGLSSMLLGDYRSEAFERAVLVARQDLERVQSRGADRAAMRRCEVLLGIAQTGAAMNLLLAGELERAGWFLAEARDGFEAVPSPYFGFYCRIRHGACVSAGDREQAWYWLRRGLELARSQGYLAEEANLELAAAKLNFSGGDLSGARQAVLKVQQLLARSNDGFVRAPLRTLEGWLGLADGQLPAAAASFLAAIEHAAAINARMNLMEPLLGYAECLTRSGRPVPARAVGRFLAETTGLPAMLRQPVNVLLGQLSGTGGPEVAATLGLEGVLQLINEAAGRELRLGRENNSWLT